MISRTWSIAWPLVLTLATSGCGGSKSGGPTGGPTAPGSVDGPAAAPLPPPPAPGSGNRYFESLAGHPDVLAAYSLRDQSMLDTYARGTGGAGSLAVTYDVVGDPDPRKQDAAKVIIPPDRVSVPTHVRLPIPPVGSDSLFVTWDVWWGKEFAFAHSQIANYKAFQFTSPATRIWTEVKLDLDRAAEVPGSLGMITVRQYGEFWTESSKGPNVTNMNPLSPMTAQFGLMPETWTRYWLYFKPVANRWFELSMWLADETRDPVLVIDRLQIKPNYGGGASGWEEFWLEYNTSTNVIPPTRGPLVAYIRNVVMLKGLSNPMTVLQRPQR